MKKTALSGIDHKRILDDQDLLDRLKADDVSALQECYARYWKKLLVVALNRMGNHSEAEECVQDVFCALWQGRANMTIHTSCAQYLAGMLKYKILDQLRKQYRMVSTTPLDELSTAHFVEADAADDVLEYKDIQSKIEQSVNSLPEKCQLVYRMSREEGTTNKEIASHFGISEKAVEKHMSRALKQLRQLYQRLFAFILF